MKNDISMKISAIASNAKFSLKKHSPEILIVSGVIGAIGSTILACRATLKARTVVEETKETLKEIKEVYKDDGIPAETYTEDDLKKDTVTVYAQTGVKIAKLYAPALIVGGLSVFSIFASNNALKKRNIALAAAYSAVDTGFKKYRKRVAERFGEDVEREIKNGIRKVKVLEESTDESGNKTTTTKTINYADPDDISPYARFFEEYTRSEDGVTVVRNPFWDESNEYNLNFLKNVQSHMNNLLKSRYSAHKGYGIVFLNEVYKALGLPMTKAGQVVGWIYKPNDPIGDNVIDFGLYKSSQNYSDFVYGNDNGILLDFNCDGNVLEYM